MPQDKILSRIKKLMALAQSANPHEAASALRKAQALMQAHALDMVDVAISDVTEHTVKIANKSSKQPEWSCLLINLIQQAFGVQATYNTWLETVTFVGIKDNSLIAGYCYQVLARQLKAGRAAYLSEQNPRIKRSTKTARADKYCEGWICGVYQHITKLVPTSEQEALINAYCSENRPATIEGKIRPAKSNKATDIAMSAGYRDGERVRLNAGMTGQPTLMLSVHP